MPFHEVHAEVDPRHGRGWLEKAIVPFLAEHRELTSRVVDGALWRLHTNDSFINEVSDTMRNDSEPACDDAVAEAC